MTDDYKAADEWFHEKSQAYRFADTKEYRAIRKALRIAQRVQELGVVDPDSEIVACVAQKANGNDAILTSTHIKPLPPYECLFLFTTFNKSILEHLIRSCGCDENQAQKLLEEVLGE